MVFGVQKEQFLFILRDELTRQGIAPAAAGRYVRAIEQTLSDDDISEIEALSDPSEIAELAHGIALIKKRSSEAAQPAAPDTPASAPADVPARRSTAAPVPPEPDTGSSDADNDDDMKVYGSDPLPFSASDDVPDPGTDDEKFDEIIGDDDLLPPESSATARGKRIFWGIFAVTLPLSAVLLLLYFAVFGAAFAALCSLIILLVAALIGGVAAGTALSLTGIVYGITQLISVPSSAPGLYEIGLGVGIAGVVLFGGVLVYNLAIRLIPLLIRCLASLFRFCTGELRSIFHRAKEACYKL